ASASLISLSFFSSLLHRIVDSCQKGVNGSADNIGIHAGAPAELSVRPLNSHISDSTGTGACFQRVLLIGYQIVLETVTFLQRVADCSQTAVSSCVSNLFLSLIFRMHLGGNAIQLFEMYLCNVVRRCEALEFLFEKLENLLGHQLLVLVIRFILGRIAHGFTHLGRKIQSEVVLQDVAYAAFSRLAVDTDHVRVVFAVYIGRIDRQIRNGPMLRVVLLPVMHSLCDSILMRTGESREHKSSRIGASLIHLHACEFLISLTYLRHIAEV